jgi:hypothetical protein
LRSRPTIQLCSDDAPRHRESSRSGIAIGLSATVLFGAVVYAGTELGQPGPWVATALLAIVVAASVPAARRWLL